MLTTLQHRIQQKTRKIMKIREKAIELIKELERNREALPPYNTDLVNEVTKEIKQLIELNKEDARENDNNATIGGISYISTVRMRHSAVQRNIRCLLAYHYNRIECLKTMRWEFGSILPADIKANLSPSEIEWFSKYSSNLAQYMRSIGEAGGVNLAVDLRPPKALYVEVRCLVDYGRHELNDGTVVLLKQNSRHYLPRSECEELIRRGIFQHIV